MPKKRAKKAPEGFSKMEDKFKLSLLNMERRFMDLEMAVSGLSERVKSGQIESIQAVNQRLGDIEDLMMVEQAGLIELKKIMQRAEDKFQTAIGFDERVEKRLNEEFDKKLGGVQRKIVDVEKKITSAEELAKKTAKKAEEPSELKEEVEERISLIEREIAQVKTRPPAESVSPLEIGELRSKLRNLSKKLAFFESSVGELKASVDVKIKEEVEEALKGTTGKGVDFEFIKAKMDALKIGVGTLSEKRAESDMKMGELEERVGMLNRRVREMPKKTFDEIKGAKSGLETAKVRIESLERVVRELIGNLNEMETKAKRFESLERLTHLKKEVDEKLRRFKFLEEEMTKLSTRMEVIYNNLDKRLAGVKNQERDIRRLSESTKEFVKDLEQIKIEMDARVEKKDVGKVLHAVEEKVRSVDDIGKIVRSMDGRVSDLRQEIKRLKDDVQDRAEKKEIGRIVGKVVHGIEERTKRVESIGKEARYMRHEFSREFENIRKEVEGVKKGLSELKGGVRAARKEDLPEGFKIVVNDLDVRMSGVEKALEMIQSFVGELSQRMQEPSMYDMRLKELLDKFIFLESRLTAMESMLQETRPIILE